MRLAQPFQVLHEEGDRALPGQSCGVLVVARGRVVTPVKSLEAADQEIVFGGDGAGHAAAGGDAVFAHLVFGDADDGEGAVDDDGAGVADVVGVREVAALF